MGCKGVEIELRHALSQNCGLYFLLMDLICANKILLFSGKHDEFPLLQLVEHLLDDHLYFLKILELVRVEGP